MKKLIDFKDENLVKLIQEYADKYCEGNFNQAVRKIAVKFLVGE